VTVSKMVVMTYEVEVLVIVRTSTFVTVDISVVNLVRVDPPFGTGAITLMACFR